MKAITINLVSQTGASTPFADEFPRKEPRRTPGLLYCHWHREEKLGSGWPLAAVPQLFQSLKTADEVGKGGELLLLFGVDGPEIDDDPIRWPAHRLLRRHEFYIIENLALWPAVAELPRRFRLIAMPLAIQGATAAPARVVAVAG